MAFESKNADLKALCKRHSPWKSAKSVIGFLLAIKATIFAQLYVTSLRQECVDYLRDFEDDENASDKNTKEEIEDMDTSDS